MRYGWAPIEDIHKRIGHITVAYRHQIIVWGGFMADNHTLDDKPSEQIWFYNTLTEIWNYAETSGDIPNGYSGSTGVVCDHCLYLFGGIVDENNGFVYTNNLHRLNLRTLVWSKLEPSGPIPERCDKGVGWEYKNKIYIFGGYGDRPQNQTENPSYFHLDLNNQGFKGWNNQFFCYDPVENSWSVPKVKGVPPVPRAAHAADIIGERAFICGGREGNIRKNDLYCINMETLTWSINLNHGKDPIPEGISWHSFTFVKPNKAVLYGGLKHYGSPSLDWWECTIDNNNDVTWKQQPQLVNPLVWHKAATSKVTGELIIVGGVCDSPYEMNEQDHVDQLLVLRYRPISLFRLCLNIIVKDKNLQMMANNLPQPLLDLIISRSNQANVSTEI